MKTLKLSTGKQRYNCANEERWNPSNVGGAALKEGHLFSFVSVTLSVVLPISLLIKKGIEHNSLTDRWNHIT